MLKRMTVGVIVAVCAALALRAQVGAQQPAAAGRGRAVGAAIGNGPGYPTTEQYANSKEAQALVAKAKAIAGNDPVLQGRFEKSCGPLGPQRPAILRQNAGLPPEPTRQIEPVKIFDNLYYFGFNTVGAWAVPTSQGIILIDTLNSAKDAEEVIEPALKKFGMNPADVKMIILAHAHFDHFGGAPYFQQKYGSKVAMSRIDWDALAKPNPNATPAQASRPLPKRDVEITTDGQQITLGDETITLRITPGHTEGALAYYIPVKDHGKPMTALILGGANITPDRASLTAFDNAMDAAKAAKVQAVLNGHPDLFGDELGWMEQIRSNPTGPNPFVLTQPQFSKFIDIMKACAESRVVAMDLKGTN